ncbi:MAG: hypothetical protein M3033_04700 [Acidobacteriota bacterium]|nr:hypothetical protein [Acidobacteriota bacterium]
MKSLIDSFDEQFSQLHARSCEIVRKIPTEKLYWQPRESNQLPPTFSCAEYILRSAGRVEQTFGGITAKLWDDPFEWTLPEELSTNEKILEYFSEVEAMRVKGFNFFTSDEDLRREIPAPEKLQSIFEILLETITRAEHLQGRAFAIFQMFSDEQLPRL